MITEDYVSFETAKLLKEKGFDEPCRFIYDAGYFCSIASTGCRWNEGYGELVEELPNSEFSGIDNRISAPTIQMAMKWLREVHNLHIEVYRTACGYLYIISSVPAGSDLYSNHDAYDGDDENSGEWTTHEKACESAIKYCLKNLI